MMAGMDDLVPWLRAQLDEDERVARAAGGAAWRLASAWDWSIYTIDGGEVVSNDDESGLERESADHIALHHPARVLAEVEAKRQIVGAHARPHECISLTGKGDQSVVDGKPWELWEPEHTGDSGPCFVLRCLALPYTDRRGYRDEWRPE